MNSKNLSRFIDAQNQLYLTALAEIKSGRKQSHWMWFVFPQLHGLGKSETAKYYAISGIEEATAYLAHPVLGKHLVDIATAVLAVEGKTANDIFGSPDDMKLHSSMTLFSSLPDADPVFKTVIDRFFNAKPDQKTIELLQLQNKKHDTI